MLTSADLLRRLEPAVRRGGPGLPVEPIPGIGDASFDRLLTLVASGRLRSDRAVDVAPGLALDPPLDPEQLGRLAAATDDAQAAGSRRAIMLIDGRALVVDVLARRVDTEATAGDAPITDIDAAVSIPTSLRLAGAAAPASATPSPAGSDSSPGDGAGAAAGAAAGATARPADAPASGTPSATGPSSDAARDGASIAPSAATTPPTRIVRPPSAVARRDMLEPTTRPRGPGPP